MMKYQDLFLEPVAFSADEIERARNGDYKPASERLNRLVGELNRRHSTAKPSASKNALGKLKPKRPKTGS